ncbi:LOW QUALITY PROTEIN: UDP-glucuronosyltransferase-like [Xyrichtys novacula]|uniref:UDP-glucuronosyltransferase n=1 Tax=Xyrichtys novacula TaxID=13765 RepID=A0AAV1GD17_XYRNO|nr:LOW QUALITY PROTEIN: UDP-glucuronosyltransferase-like [Xyrichtys novacula]
MSGGVWFPRLGLVAWLCFLSLGPAQGGKVLVLPVDGSHWLSMKILVKELNQRGHEVLVLVPDSSLLIHSSESFKTEVYPVSFSQADLDSEFDQLTDGLFAKSPQIHDILPNVERLVSFTTLQVEACESLLNNQPLMSRLRSGGFDLVLTDPFLPCGSVVSHLLSIPAVYFMNGLPCALDSKAILCPSPLSYVPVAFSGNTNIMTFPQRVKNVLMSFVESYMCKKIYGHFDDLVRKHVKEMTTYKELISHGAVWLLRSDFTTTWPKPIMPNVVFIGGINCAKKAPLPADLQEFVEGSGDHGFIVFTLGSMVSNMPEETAKQFFEAFRQLPQRVLWRYTGAPPKDLPKNVKLMKWLPQNDLLAHPKAKVFITHGGSHGIYESIYNAVPMLMFPLFGDQGDNVHHMVARGVAESLAIYDVTTEKLVTALNKIINIKSYKENMVKMSQVHLDRPVEPLDLAVFWTEFVMRHKGASHLRVAAHELNWIQYHCLDVIGFFIVILLTVVWLMLKCCSVCFHKCCKKEKAKMKKK